MVVPGLARDWSIRLDHLVRVAQSDPPGSAWLCRIRIRVLRFMISRYGASAPATEAGGFPDAGIDELPERHPRPPADVLSVMPPIGVAHPPKLRSEIAPVLKDLREINDQRRCVEGDCPEPDVIWEWWCSVWCRR